MKPDIDSIHSAKRKQSGISIMLKFQINVWRRIELLWKRWNSKSGILNAYRWIEASEAQQSYKMKY